MSPIAATSQGQTRAAERIAKRARSKMAEDLERLCSDAGITFAELARAARVPHSHVSRILSGKVEASLETYAKLAVPLGADLSTRLYPNTGPLIRDRHQARIVEALLRLCHPRWRRFTEVGVRHPARGWIDAVLHDEQAQRVLAVEVESDIRRIEQQVRWARMKADSLSSWDLWPGGHTQVSRLMIVRRTRATRQTAQEFGRQLAVAYPAHPQDAIAALTGTSTWPGDALVWAELGPERVRLLETR